jgi:hypothetical protein
MSVIGMFQQLSSRHFTHSSRFPRGKRPPQWAGIASELPPLSKLIALPFIRSHVAAARVLSIGARLTALVGPQQMA